MEYKPNWMFGLIMLVSLFVVTIWISYLWIHTYTRVKQGDEFWIHVWAMNGEWLFHLIGCIALVGFCIYFMVSFAKNL